ncbi:MAG: hypothetical protein K8S97_06845 [Anaerolineae bacterium]|nr:hypothetical protein [Anaerolineae bacterium]
MAHYPTGTSKWNPIEHRHTTAQIRNYGARPATLRPQSP